MHVSDNRKYLMEHYSVNPLSITLRPSWLLAAMLTLVCVACTTLALMLPVPLWGRGLAALMLLGATAYAVLLHACLRMPHSVDAFEIGLHGQLRCHTPRHDWQETTALGSSFVTPWMTVLHLHMEGQRFARSVVLLPDALDAEDFRGLRVWLRWGSEAVLTHD
jgi:toxin CptA